MFLLYKFNIGIIISLVILVMKLKLFLFRELLNIFDVVFFKIFKIRVVIVYS